MFQNLNKFAYFIIFLVVFIFIFKVFIKILPIILIFGVVFFFPYQKVLKKITGLFLKTQKDYSTKQEVHCDSGKVYKQCNYCKKRAEMTSEKCDFCGKNFK